MAIYSDISRQSVLAAVRECDAKGRDRFLAEHGYGRARSYYLTLNGVEYDSKAVLGVAYGYEHPEAGPLPFDAFSGGEATVGRHLRKLGFVVRVHSANTPLVLVQNEQTAGGDYDFWKDATGERYHFPNTYRKRVREGRPFVYYRGSRRARGRKAAPEYFGWGRIGSVWRDPDIPESEPKARWRWFCNIEDYVAFRVPVRARFQEHYLERIEHQNLWQVGVRELPEDVFHRILELAGIDSGTLEDLPKGSVPVSDVEPVVKDTFDLLVARGGRKAAPVGSSSRRSRYSKHVGDWAEAVVYRHLHESLPNNEARALRWVAQEGETPGWDIEYVDAEDNLVAVEVKGTVGAAFPSFDLTANEWAAAQRMGVHYAVFLVCQCLTAMPELLRIDDPYHHFEAGTLDAAPNGWRITASARSDQRDDTG